MTIFDDMRLDSEAGTPGPWRVGPVDDTRVEASNGECVAEIDGDYNQPDLWPIMEANARRIARVPELERIAMAVAWQPIETAPHETPVLLYCPDRGCPSNRERIELGCYSTGERVGHTSTMSYHSWATHWMPLPKPPAGENGND